MINPLHTKFLIPRFTAERLPRPHLTDKIHANLRQRLILLIAPPGYGKTTLMAEVVDNANLPTVWYQLDEGDNDPATFIAYLIEGLRRVLPDVGNRLSHLLEDSGPHPPARALIILMNDLVENPTQAWTLVMDDYQLINNPQVHSLTTTLLDNPPLGMSVIIASRSTPSLPLARWRARGRMIEIRAEHLRFSTDEMMTWLAMQESSLPEATVNDLVEKTEGWGAGLRLALNLLAEQRATSLNSEAWLTGLGGAHPYIFSYLMEEVLERQPAMIQQFLLRSAALTQMNRTICREVLDLDDAAQMLDRLEHDNLFLISLDDQHEWFRYHHLFREFLLNRLARQDQAALNALQMKIGDYYFAKGESEAAAQHYFSAGDTERSIIAVGAFAADYLNRGRVDILHRYFIQLGTALDDQPDLLLLYGRVLRQMGRIHEAVVHLQSALEIARDEDTACLALTELASIARAQGDYRLAQRYDADAYHNYPAASPAARAFAIMEAAKSEGYLNGMDRGRELAEQAIKAMESAQKAISAYQQAELLRGLAQICWWQGDVAAAVANCNSALRRLPNHRSPLGAQILLTLAIPCLYRHEYAAALQHAEQALAICQQLQLREMLPTAYTTLGNVLTRVGQIAQAENCLRQAIDLAADLGAASYAQVMAAGYLAYNLAAQGRTDEAQQIAEAALWPYEGLPVVYEIFVCRSVLADTYLNDGQVGHAEQIFDELIAIGETRQYRIPLAMAYFGKAYVCFTQGGWDDGLRFAQLSLELLEPTHSWELYVDQGQRAFVVCQALAQRIPSSNFVRQVLRVLTSSQLPLVSLADMPDRIKVKTLGSMRVYQGEQEIDPRLWVSIKARDLLAYFVTFRHESIPLDRALEALWTEPDRGSKTAFHTALYRLRKALRVAQESAKYVLVEAGDYRLDLARFEVDVDVFDKLYKQAQRAHGSEAVECYQSALDLYDGEYLNNLYYDWLLPERARLTEAYVSGLGELARLTARSGDLEEALLLARKALAINPFLENVHCDIMRYLNQIGDQQGIVRQYHSLCDLLRDELNANPHPSTRQLFATLITSNSD